MSPLDQIDVVCTPSRAVGGGDLDASFSITENGVGTMDFPTPGHDSASSEISLDILANNNEDTNKARTNDDSLCNEGSISRARWNVNSDLDYSLNVLLPPRKQDRHDEEHYRTQAASKTALPPLRSKKQQQIHASFNDSDYSLKNLLRKHRYQIPPDAKPSSSIQKASKKVNAPPKKKMAAYDPTLSSSVSSFASSATAATEATADSHQSTATKTKTPSPETTTSTRSPRIVKFFPRVRIQRVPNRADLSERHYRSVWYNREEFKDIRRDCFATIQRMGEEMGLRVKRQEERLVDGYELDVYCTRGLEYKTPSLYKERQHRKSELRTAVFDEQDFQMENGMQDDEWIAKVSLERSQSCVLVALKAASKDEAEAAMIHQEMP